MNTIKMSAAVAAVLALLSGCGGGGGDGGSGANLVAVPVGAWSSLDAAESVPRNGRQLYVLPPVTAGGSSEAWGLEFEVIDSAANPTTLVYAQLQATTSDLTGSGGVQNLTVNPSTYEALPTVSVVPSVSGGALTLSAGTTSWTLAKTTLAATEGGLWSGSFSSTAAGGALALDWNLASTTLSASDNTGCTYEGSIEAVDHADLAGVVRVSYASTNTVLEDRTACGDWQGMGTVARDQAGNVAGRTLWLRKLTDGSLQCVSLTPAS